jgi:16S rRNA (guanine(966)-N(2))-methyltransferase RsmD
VRIIGGEWKGRRLTAPAGNVVRPTPDRVREAWMSILQLDLPSARIVDLFAGTGALGLEALSRGAAHVDFVENDAQSLKTLRANIAALGGEGRCAVRRADAVRYAADLGPGAYAIAFADPPYRLGIAEELAKLWLNAPFSTIFGLEHEATAALPDGGDRRRYGDTAITFYRI